MSRTADPAELLAHAPWVRALARHLTRDDEAAADLEQETWLAALRNPPRVDAERDLRHWLAEVLRNVRRMRHRSDTRRTQREDASHDIAKHDATRAAAADELLAEIEVGRQLAEEVLALDEPYRQTVLFHYYRGLSSGEIARQEGVADGTVRWRLKEGLDRLRVRLDRTHGDRESWLRALAPVAAAPLLPRGAPASAAKGALMTKLLVAAFCTAGVGTAVYVHHAANAGTRASTRAPTSPTSVNAGATPSTAATSTPASATATATKADKAAARKAHDELAQRIADAQRKAAAATGVPTGTLDKQYVIQGIREILPLFTECFEQGLTRNENLSGRVQLKFTIAADPTLGGIVVASDVVGSETTVVDPETRQCFQESIYAARFPPPSNDGTVDVSYPFMLAPAGTPLPPGLAK